MQIISGIGVQLGRFASKLAARHRAATELRQLYQFDDRSCGMWACAVAIFLPSSGHPLPRLTAVRNPSFPPELALPSLARRT